MRGTDMLARWGGEEFCLLLTGCDEHRATAVLEDMRALTPDGQSFSAGVASWQPGTTAQEIVERADEALYAAKHRGRARTIVAGAHSLTAAP